MRKCAPAGVAVCRLFFFFQAEDGIRDLIVTGVQTCALPIYVDALLGALGLLVAKKRDLKQAAMQQLLTGQTRLPGFQGEWDEKRLGNLGATRSEERRVGEECRSRWSPDH